jgi:heme ABC exporter ATP-binding subunit CcmA
VTEIVNAIQTSGLTKVFQGRTVLRNVDLEVAEAECVALTGANGAGKTTLLRCLCGAIRPHSGTVLAYGQDTRTNRQIRHLMGYLAHEQQVYPHLTVRENLVFAARMTDVHQPSRRVDELLEQTALRLFADSFPTSISRGIRQRLAIARALVHDPRIVLLDEPFTGLDRQGCEWLAQWIGQMRDRGRTICFTTHDPEWSRRLARRALCLQAGELQTLAQESNDHALRMTA